MSRARGLCWVGLLAFGVASCTGNGAAGGSPDDPAAVQLEDAELDAIDAKAEAARGTITAENADAELRRLEAELSGKKK